MKKLFFILLLVSSFASAQQPASEPAVTTIKLPEPDLNGKISIEQTILNRRSIRQFTTETLSVKQVGQLCWSAQGITEPNKGLRAAPSAGAIYPMQLYVVLSDGLYLYSPKSHSLQKQIDGDIRSMLRTAAFGQKTLLDSPCTFIIAGSLKKIEVKYRGKSERFAYLEAGHIAENIHLQAVALGLGSAPIGAFVPKSVAGVCGLSDDLEVLYLVCAGKPVEEPALKPAISGAPLATTPIEPQEEIRNKRVAIIVPSKLFNDREYFGISDALQLVGIQPVVASSVKGDIKGLERNIINVTTLIKDLKVDDFDAFVFTGGPATGIREYFSDPDVLGIVRTADKENKIIVAIGTAPAIFANAGIIKDRIIASAVSQRRTIIAAGGDWRNTSIEIDYNMITSNGPDSSMVSRGDSDIAQRVGTALVNALREPLPPRSAAKPAPAKKRVYPRMY